MYGTLLCGHLADSNITLKTYFYNILYDSEPLIHKDDLINSDYSCKFQ